MIVLRNLRIIFFFVFAFFLPQVVRSQVYLEDNNTDSIKVQSVQELFTKGKLHGHVRNYFMATGNHRELTNHYANAIGAEVGMRTAAFHGLRVNVSGIFTYNLFSSNLAEKDPIGHKRPLTERELFDIEDSENKYDLDRLESAYLEYNSKKLRSKLGRFSFHSPLINPQDTRMKPYTVQGVQVELPVGKNSLATLAWLDHFSPRSVVEWKKAEETIGIYSPGVNFNGEPGRYQNQTHTKGVAVAGLVVGLPGKLQWQGWNYWIENISNTSYGRILIPARRYLKFGFEGLYQFQVGNGGHSSSDTTYFPDQREWLAGAMISYQKSNSQISLNFLYTGNSGRFTFPREWGREQFFATIPRGRLEGTGAANLLVVKAKKIWSPELSSGLAIAKAWLPAINDFPHNKYGVISYWSPMVDLTLQPEYRPLKGVVFRLLYVAKASPGAKVPLGQMFYNTNYHQINFITQLNF
ncbi:MAG: porin [Adhaeribacter sp.]